MWPTDYDIADDSWRAFLEALPGPARRKLQPCTVVVADACAAMRDHGFTPDTLAARVAAPPVDVLNRDGANRLMKYRLSHAAGHMEDI